MNEEQFKELLATPLFQEIAKRRESQQINRKLFDACVQKVDSLPSCPNDLTQIVAESKLAENFDLKAMTHLVIGDVSDKELEISSAFIGPTFVAVFARARQAA